MFRRWLKRIAVVAGIVLGLGVAAVVVGGLWLNHELNESLAVLVGDVRLAGLSAPVTVERDDLGVPTVRGANRIDVARATGFLHAQDRFFQMDLLRRRAAGELAELVGPAVLAEDRRNRLHRFRAVAQANVATVEGETRALLEAYAAGVNAGLTALETPPPEYLALRTEPKPWAIEDTTLVVLAMYMELQDHRGRRESNLGLIADLLPRDLFEFLTTPGTEWDAPIVGEPFATPPIPPAEVFDLRAISKDDAPAQAGQPPPYAGSNGWAVAGVHTDDGGALLANDIHLPHSLPNIWYRMSLVWPGPEGKDHRVTGATLPGAPVIIVGSNGHVAWGFTNSQVDFSDLVVLESDPEDDDTYATSDGPRKIEHVEERIRVKGGDDELLDVEQTVWGPVIDRDHRGRRRVLRWIAHDVEGTNFGLLRMELARDVDEALEIAAHTRIPTQNCQIADRDGRIAWTLMGPLPRRIGFDGATPRSWAGGDVGWDGYLSPAEYPRVVDPPSGRVWSGNNRVVSGDMLARIGDGGFVLGARARQVRDDLMAIARASERDMLDVQLDDRALFLERWRELLLETLSSGAVAGDSRRGELRRLVEETWTGRASIDSVGFHMVRAFRLYLTEQVIGSITSVCKEADDRFSYWSLFQLEGPLWKLVTERPAHLLDPRFESWDEQLLSAVDAVLDRFADEDGSLAQQTWGNRNTVLVRHPLSLAVPQLSRWLDIPPRPLPGAGNMPRVQSVRFGASMRMAVTPGREEDGLFHMPGGQSGHPRSPYYRAGHDAWADGEPTPFLPGPAVHRLTLLGG
jgi:penicillin amidase